MHKNCIIAGPTNAGKTILCCQLDRGYGFSRISGDALVMAFQKSFPELHIGHSVEDFSPDDGYEITCRQFGGFLVDFTNALAWESTMPYVLDTFHVRPEDLAGIDRRKTQVLFLGYPEAGAREKALQAQAYQIENYGSASGWLAGGAAEAAEKFEIFIEMSRYYRDSCSRIGFSFYDLGHDLPGTLEAAKEQVLSQQKVYG